MKKTFLCSVLLAVSFNAMMAQSGTNSPYSQFGLGKLTDQSIGMSRGMNGVGIGLRESGHVNYLNPASYSGMDSLTFIFDVGMSLQNTNFKENGKSRNVKNGDFEYAVGSFRAMKHLGVAFGIMPYTNIGYNYQTTSAQPIEGYVQAPSVEPTTTTTSSYYGSGGLHQLFLGTGWEPIRDFSIGVNVNYLFGCLDNIMTTSCTDGNVKTLSNVYSANVNSIKLDFGVNYTLRLENQRSLIFGLTYTPGYKVGADSECRRITTNPQSGVVDTTLFVAKNSIAIPMQLGFGVSYKLTNKLLLGVDYTFLNCASASPIDYINESTGQVVEQTDEFNNRHKINIGGQYCKNAISNSFADRIRYRFGVGYSSSYLKINGKDGPSELSVSAGIGVPIINNYNNRSMLNVSLQWQHASSKQLMTENTFLINIGLTFNERWFAKWKFE